jgi:hypothetical protein
MVGEISGTVRSADGTPLAGNAVIAVPAANTQTTGMAARFRTTTDNSGHYRFTTLLPGSYHLATGYAERPVFFPGVRSLSEATLVTVAASAKVAADFVVEPAAPGVSVQGRVVSTAGVAISDADVRLVSRHNSGLALSLPQRSLTRGYTAADGSFELQDILDGSYDLEVRVSGITPVVSELVVEKESLKAIAVAVPVAMLSGRIVLEDGMPLDTEAIGAVVASTVLNPNLTSRVTFPLNAAGEFGRLIEPGRFKLSLENVPEGYAVASIKAATVDLLREDLDVTESANLRIEIILSRKP